MSQTNKHGGKACWFFAATLTAHLISFSLCAQSICPPANTPANTPTHQLPMDFMMHQERKLISAKAAWAVANHTISKYYAKDKARYYSILPCDFIWASSIDSAFQDSSDSNDEVGLGEQRPHSTDDMFILLGKSKTFGYKNLTALWSDFGGIGYTSSHEEAIHITVQHFCNQTLGLFGSPSKIQEQVAHANVCIKIDEAAIFLVNIPFDPFLAHHYKSLVLHLKKKQAEAQHQNSKHVTWSNTVLGHYKKPLFWFSSTCLHTSQECGKPAADLAQWCNTHMHPAFTRVIAPCLWDHIKPYNGWSCTDLVKHMPDDDF